MATLRALGVSFVLTRVMKNPSGKLEIWRNGWLVVKDLPEEFTRSLISWRCEEVFRRRDLHNDPLVDKRYPIGNLAGKAHFMGHNDHRHSVFGQGHHHIQ